MELGELIAPPVVHKEPNEDCPFCPPPDVKDYTTYPGKDNDSKILAAIMNKPKSLTEKQKKARPQTGRFDDKGYMQEQLKPRARRKKSNTFYTFQAHHLISGKQALQGSPMEKWIVGGKKIEKDTGYSVNYTNNGFWAPSVPNDYVGRWAKGKNDLTDKQRQKLVEKVMANANAQAHIGPHNIKDPDDPDGHIHESYDKYIKDWLKKISNRINAWSKVCGFCEKDKKSGKKTQTTHTVHDVLDRLSTHLQGEITGSRASWKIFLSKYAMDYHHPVCTHKRSER